MEPPCICISGAPGTACMYLFSFAFLLGWAAYSRRQSPDGGPLVAPRKPHYHLSRIPNVSCGDIKPTEVPETALEGRHLPLQMRNLRLKEQLQLAQGEAVVCGGDGLKLRYFWLQVQ